jgi:alkaline phosphatase
MAKQRATYVDGFVLVIPKKNAAAYKKMAAEGSRIWKKHGALDYKECVIDDASPPMVTLTFPKLAKAKPSEEVWFSFITYKSRAHRDRVNAKVMAEMQKQAEKEKSRPMPFDMKKMSFGGFKVVVDI